MTPQPSLCINITAANIAAYVVNLRRRTDRRARMVSVIPAEFNVTFTSDWDGPFDGRRLTRKELEAAGYRIFPWRIASDNSWWNRPLKLGEIGCTLTHLSCWADAVGRHEPYTLVLEDDAVLCENFTQRLTEGLRDLVGWFDLLYLGRYPLEQDRPAAPGVVFPGYSHCTFGYILTRAAMETLLALGLDQAIAPIDEVLPSLYIDHPRADLRARFPRQITALAFEPPLVCQLPKDEAGSDTEDSGFIDELPNGGSVPAVPALSTRSLG
jgi:collagen beta-1,O-galactosyltransferase